VKYRAHGEAQRVGGARQRYDRDEDRIVAKLTQLLEGDGRTRFHFRVLRHARERGIDLADREGAAPFLSCSKKYAGLTFDTSQSASSSSRIRRTPD
jgi:hypothetical protein